MIEILDPGYYITIQDLGRFGYSYYGVPQSGCMDIVSAKITPLLRKISLRFFFKTPLKCCFFLDMGIEIKLILNI